MFGSRSGTGHKVKSESHFQVDEARPVFERRVSLETYHDAVGHNEECHQRFDIPAQEIQVDHELVLRGGKGSGCNTSERYRRLREAKGN